MFWVTNYKGSGFFFVLNLPQQKLINKFILSARFSIDAGFKVIQIHAAHGYFLSLLLNPKLNSRKDIYGLKPLSIIEDIVNRIKSIDKNIIIDIRVSISDGINDVSNGINYDPIIDKITESGVDIISLSNGIYDINKLLIYPPKSKGHAPHFKIASYLAKRYPALLWNVAGNVWDIRKIPKESPQNLTFGIGRALIADPKLIEKSLAGNFDKINMCLRRGDCHYYTHGLDHLFCPIEVSGLTLVADITNTKCNSKSQ